MRVKFVSSMIVIIARKYIKLGMTMAKLCKEDDFMVLFIAYLID